MAMMSGIQASRVNNPSTINAAQKNSAKMTIANSIGALKPGMRSNFPLMLLKLLSFGRPWSAAINRPAPKRRSNKEKESAESETRVLNSFFMVGG